MIRRTDPMIRTYEDAVNVRNQAARMDETVMAFMTKTLFQ